MCALFDDFPLIQHDDAIHPRDGGQAVGNSEHCFALHHPFKGGLDRGFDFAVQRACGFVQNKDRGVL